MKQYIKKRICRDDIARKHHAEFNNVDTQTVQEIGQVIDQMPDISVKTLSEMFGLLDEKGVFDYLKQDGKSTLFFLIKEGNVYKYSISGGVGHIGQNG